MWKKEKNWAQTIYVLADNIGRYEPFIDISVTAIMPPKMLWKCLFYSINNVGKMCVYIFIQVIYLVVLAIIYLLIIKFMVKR